ncbi:hypothetical protein [Geobacter sp. SVR]|uniref:hypothetical protein n=1 Tax=Geobacter sp. SVR TaxID=2495594 RepID=UPI00143EFEE2|nr:hypothetical protein [Geobacter sp. SVR]BCS53948.1 hypothetical protein GSVR_22560 [Geobacter sp. SVR]GCF86271.1 hypothetical protein GSbR_28710 [Geobacter sp. SVR]
MRYTVFIISIILAVSLFFSFQQTQESHFSCEGNHLYPFNIKVNKIDNSNLYLDVALIPNGLLKIDKNDAKTSLILLIQENNSIIPNEKIIFLVPQNRFGNPTEVIWVNREPIIIEMKGKLKNFPFDRYLTEISYRIKYITENTTEFANIDNTSTLIFKDTENFRTNIKLKNNFISFDIKRSYFIVVITVTLFIFCLFIVINLYIDRDEYLKLHELLALTFSIISFRILLIGTLNKITILDALLIFLFLIGINHKTIKELVAKLKLYHKKITGKQTHA